MYRYSRLMPALFDDDVITNNWGLNPGVPAAMNFTGLTFIWGPDDLIQCGRNIRQLCCASYDGSQQTIQNSVRARCMRSEPTELTVTHVPDRPTRVRSRSCWIICSAVTMTTSTRALGTRRPPPPVQSSPSLPPLQRPPPGEGGTLGGWAGEGAGC